MNALKNRVQLIGNLGADPEVKETGSGKLMARFSLATNENYRNGDGEKQEATQWHQLVAWGKTAEVVSKYLKKGADVAIDGRLTTRQYEKNGENRYITEVVVNELLMLGGKK